jgi:hypothetical protein
MFAIGLVVKKALPGSMIASMYYSDSLCCLVSYISRQAASSSSLHQIAVEFMPGMQKDIQQVGCP